MTLKDKVRRAYLAGAPLAIAARAHNVRPGTARRWLQRHQWQRPLLHSADLPPAVPPPAATPAPPPPPSLWCRSLHHDWSHLVKPDGTAECDPRVTVPLGGRWFPIPADELDSVRKCKRCMPHQDTRPEVPGSGFIPLDLR